MSRDDWLDEAAAKDFDEFVEGEPGNYYGKVAVARKGERVWMAVENYDGFGWVEIGRPLFDAFVAEFGEPSSHDDVAKEAKQVVLSLLEATAMPDAKLEGEARELLKKIDARFGR